jgi:hypothetical protein
MPKRNKFFYGDDGNDVDIAQRHAPRTLSNAGNDPTENIVRAAMRARRPESSDDDVKGKRLEDNVRDSQAGFDTTPADDARLRSDNVPGLRGNEPIPDEYTELAERMVGKNSWGGNTPLRAKFVEYFANQLREAAPAPVEQDEEQEKPFNSNEFWNNPAELQKAAKQVRPRKL